MAQKRLLTLVLMQSIPCLSRVITGDDFYHLVSTSQSFRAFARMNKDYHRVVDIRYNNRTFGLPPGITGLTYRIDKRVGKGIQSLPNSIIKLTLQYLDFWYYRNSCLCPSPIPDFIMQNYQCFPRTLRSLTAPFPTKFGLWDLAPFTAMISIIFTDELGPVITEKSHLVLPPNLKRLTIDCTGHFEPVSKGDYWHLPKGVRHLAIKSVSTSHLVGSDGTRWILPASVTHLDLRGLVSSSFLAIPLPENIESLKVYGMMDMTDVYYKWPPTLHSIYAGRCNTRFNSLRRLCLTLSQDGSDLEKLSNITHIYLADVADVHWCLEWPVTLKVLQFERLDQSIQSWKFPSGLTHLLLGHKFDRSVIGLDLPNGLTHLDLGESFNQPVIVAKGNSLKQFNLPPNLCYLGLGKSFNRPVVIPQGAWTLPESLRFITVSESISFDYDWKLQWEHHPTTTFNRAVIMATGIGNQIVSWEIPPNVVHLDLGKSFSRPVRVNNVEWKMPRHAVHLVPRSLHNLAMNQYIY